MSDGSQPAERQTSSDSEANLMIDVDWTDSETADLIGTVMLSVIRDMTLSGFYGKNWHTAGTLPSLNNVFTPTFAAELDAAFRSLDAVKDPIFPVYGNIGDALGMLSRLLVCCRDVDELQPFVDAADVDIASLGLSAQYMNDNRFIRHLRNAVLHSHFKVFPNADNPFNSQFVFIDVHKSAVTAKLTLSNTQLIKVIRIILHDVFEAYLANLPDNKRWVVGL